MSDPIYFHDNQRRAAEHLLDSPFGARLFHLGAVERRADWLSIDSEKAENWLSSGELVLLGVLESLGGHGRVNLLELWRLDDGAWDRVIAALFIARGRVLEAAS